MNQTDLNVIKARCNDATDAEFIGYARQDVPELLEHIREIEGQAEIYRQETLRWAEVSKEDKVRYEDLERLMSAAVGDLRDSLKRVEQAEKAAVEVKNKYDEFIALYNSEDVEKLRTFLKHNWPDLCSVDAWPIGRAMFQLRRLQQEKVAAEKATTHMNGCRNLMANAFNQYGAASSVHSEEGMKQAAEVFWKADKEHESIKPHTTYLSPAEVRDKLAPIMLALREASEKNPSPAVAAAFRCMADLGLS
jgi:hypothetical protein